MKGRFRTLTAVLCMLCMAGTGLNACGSAPCEDQGGRCIVPLPDEDGDGCFTGEHPVPWACDERGHHCCVPN